MDKIADVRVEPIAESNYVSPFRVTYRQNGVKKTWDVMKSHDSVAVLIHNVTRNVFVFVRQFRPAVYINRSRTPLDGPTPVDTEQYPGHLGICWELCAGIVDKDLPLPELAAAEVMEECGYKIDPKNLERISTWRSGVGLAGSEQTMYYTEVTDEMKVGPGGGCPEEGELIEVAEIPSANAVSFAMDETKVKPVGMCMALLWFAHYKQKGGEPAPVVDGTALSNAK